MERERERGRLWGELEEREWERKRERKIERETKGQEDRIESVEREERCERIKG